MKDHYKILGIPFEATASEIRKAYYALAQKYHPDKNAGSQIFEERFKEINQAYQVLSNPNERHHYDDLYRYIILKQNQYSSQQYYEAYQQQHKNQQPQYTAPTREHEVDYSSFYRVIPFVLYIIFRSCSDSNNNSGTINFDVSDVRKVYQDSSGNVINGTLEQFIRDQNDHNAFEVDYSEKGDTSLKHLFDIRDTTSKKIKI